MSIRCEDFAAALTTGGPIRRWRAARHASRCPHCASIRDELQRVGLTLVEVLPLSTVQRALWIAAAVEDDAPVSLWTRPIRPVLVGALASVLLVGFGVWWASRPVDLRVGPTTTVEIVEPESVPNAETLPGVAEFARELEELRRQADLLDARKDLDTLLARLVSRGDARGL